jgi:hypothetical protein
MYMLQEKPSALKREHPALQKLKFINFFLFLWVIFTPLDPDPDHPVGSRSITLTERKACTQVLRARQA